MSGKRRESKNKERVLAIICNDVLVHTLKKKKKKKVFGQWQSGLGRLLLSKSINAVIIIFPYSFNNDNNNPIHPSFT